MSECGIRIALFENYINKVYPIKITGFREGASFYLDTKLQASRSQFEARTEEGLIMGHAYSITGMRMVIPFFESIANFEMIPFY